jgi:heme/copper-type cytochrome/quinol oxidase subunit 2
MKLLIVLGVLVIFVLLCDKNEDHLPQPIKMIYGCWKKFSHILGIIMSFLILSVLWIIGFGIYGIIMKVITLPKKFKAEPNSYWIDCEATTVESMKHQF